MSLLLFVIAIIVSFIVVRLGAIAFQLTGLERSLARFQALSCFTGTGFTTKEAELIMGNPQRRRIASVLMVFGSAGLVTLIATFANSIRPAFADTFTIPFVDLELPSQILPWANLAIIIVAIYAIYRIFTHTKMAARLSAVLRRRLLKTRMVKPVSFEELLVATGGYGVTSVDVGEGSPIAAKTLREADLRRRDITVLVLERQREVMPNPGPDTKILLNDRLICFGKLDTTRRELCLKAE